TISLDRTLKVWKWREGKLLTTIIFDSALSTLAKGQRAGEIAVGEDSGRVHFLQLERLELGSPFATPWRDPLSRRLAFGCPLCRRWQELGSRQTLGSARCSECAITVEITPFVIDAN